MALVCESSRGPSPGRSVTLMSRPRAGTAASLIRQWMQIGPGESGISDAIRQMPDKEHRILRRRLAEHQANMQASLAGVKGRAEG